MIIPYNNIFWDYNFKLYRMTNMHWKYNNMHMNEIFYALIYVNNHVITSIS